MDKRFNLQSLQDLSSLRLEQATRQLGQLIAGEKQDEARLQLLVQYRQEYHALFLEAAGKGLDPASWQNYQKFLAKLDEAVEQARTMAMTAKNRTAAGQKNWLDKRGKVKAYDTLAQRFRARIAYEESRYEQKQADEHAARFLDKVGKDE
ncbi:MAG: flagellar export protein FliJ [Pseudomonadota bacterium]